MFSYHLANFLANNTVILDCSLKSASYEITIKQFFIFVLMAHLILFTYLQK